LNLPDSHTGEPCTPVEKHFFTNQQLSESVRVKTMGDQLVSPAPTKSRYQFPSTPPLFSSSEPPLFHTLSWLLGYYYTQVFNPTIAFASVNQEFALSPCLGIDLVYCYSYSENVWVTVAHLKRRVWRSDQICLLWYSVWRSDQLCLLWYSEHSSGESYCGVVNTFYKFATAIEDI
jgi:hypothetical protein